MNKLIKKYPEFFDYLKEDKSGMIMPMHFGIECDKGWYWLIENLMSTIYQYCKNNDKKIPDILQIKEKFGGLRFYIQGGNELIDGMIWYAEHLSYHICEKCGSTTQVGQTQKGWIYTICKDCYEKSEKYQRLEWKENI